MIQLTSDTATATLIRKPSASSADHRAMEPGAFNHDMQTCAWRTACTGLEFKCTNDSRDANGADQ
jgi:hypothetical protein